MKKHYFALLSLCIVALVITACSPIGLQDSSSSQELDDSNYVDYDLSSSKELSITTFKSEEDFITLFSQSSYYGAYAYSGGLLRENQMLDSSVSPVVDYDSEKTSSSQESTNDFSGTNVQVQGVDEADILKTDGEYIYSISGKNLHIIKAYPGEEAEIVSTITLDHTPSSLFIYENTLAVFGSFYDDDFFDEIHFRPQNGMTYFNMYSIEDKENPVLEKELKLDGSYLNARLIGEDVYFVMKNTPDLVGIYPLPIVVDGVAVKEMDLSSVHYFPVPYDRPELVSVHTIDLLDKEVKDSEAIVIDYYQSIYMSEDNLYVVSGHHINEYRIQQAIVKDLLVEELSVADKELINRIKRIDVDILSQSEKEQKIMQVYYDFVQRMSAQEQDDFQDLLETKTKEAIDEIAYFDYTVVNKFKASNDDLSFEASAQIPGNTINQFSFDEYKGNLRLATTIPQRWSNYGGDVKESSNNVFVLNKELEIVGEITDLAQDERIYSTRFIDDRLYMVTFKQIDPFFVIDLSNPKKPNVLGELKIPGFSKYLHPYDEDHVIGIGQDVSVTGRTKGLKISLFNVEDVRNPVEVAQFVSDERYAQSSALYEHKAFLFSKDKNLLVLPVYNPDYSWDDDGSDSYNGAFVFNISEEEIALRGLIDHSKASDSYWAPAVQRSLYINELLYTKSEELLRINALDDLRAVNDLELSTQSSDFPIF